jgi:hypothetical protein
MEKTSHTLFKILNIWLQELMETMKHLSQNGLWPRFKHRTSKYETEVLTTQP